MREAAFILLASQPPEQQDDEWEHEEQLAAEGKWDELDIDPPPDMKPSTVQEFLADG